MSTRATKMMVGFVAGALTAILLTAGAVPNAGAQTPAEFYKGKTVTIVVGFDPGADFDVQARMIAPFLSKAMGTNAISVEDRPGAAGTIARNDLFTAKPDGLTIMYDHGPRLVFNGLLMAAGVKYDWKKFIWVGKVFQEDALILVGRKLPWEKPQDLVGQKFIMGVSRPFYEPLFAEALDWGGMRAVPGFQSISERATAIARGEIQATLANTAFFSDMSTVKPIVITLPHKNYPKVLTVRETALPGREKWVGTLEGFQKIQYSFVAPPGVPEDRIRFIEDCLRKIYGDPEFRKKADSLGLDFPSDFMGSKELKESTSSLASLSPEEIKNLKYVMEEKYVPKK
jgi:tripartite-type tricarboxylate transporter receptor subunit TctC